VDIDSYLAVATPASAEPPRTKGSRFIGEAYPVRSEADAAALVASVRRREHAATHWCWAARLGAPGASGDGSRPRYSDDGEPAGSAGLPILREIDRRGLSDTLVIVTRYYGGVKLGAGGLARAYGEAAALALDAAVFEERVLREAVVLRFGFDDTAAALGIARRFEAEFDRPEYDESGASLVVRPPRSRADEMMAAFVDATAGRGAAERRDRD
jgi:uncharacterized YigZ family protein